jgi:hypothetical protein
VNPLGWLLQRHTPEYVRQAALAQLFSAAAEAFQCDAPPLGGLSSDERLRRFASFTRDQIVGAHGRAPLPSCDLAAVQQRLYDNAYRLGRRTGRLLGVHGVCDTMAIGRVLYRILDIEFQGDGRGDVLISRCFFSDFYTGPDCRVMSAMDWGLLAGLAGGGELAFSSRITEGQPCCKAHFTLGEDRIVSFSPTVPAPFAPSLPPAQRGRPQRGRGKRL